MPPHEEAVHKYEEVVSMLAPHVDLIICETVVSVASAKANLEALHKATSSSLLEGFIDLLSVKVQVPVKVHA